MSELRRPVRRKWRQIIDAQRASGLTVAAYCIRHRISQPSFYTWKRRLGCAVPAFVEVTTAGTSAAVREGASGIEVFLRGGRGLLARRGFDHDLLVELVQTLERLP